MKLLFCGDPHFRTKGSIYRKDDYYTAQFSKFEQILNIGQQRKVDGVVLLGDLFHSPREVHELVRDVMTSIHKFNVPVYAIVGNHDITGYALSSLKTSPLGVLAESGLVTLLGEGTEFPDKVVVRGVDYRPDHALDKYVLPDMYQSHLRVIAAHTMIAPFDEAPFSFVHPEKVVTNAHLVFSGHLHHPFDYISNSQDQRPHFINPGVPMRWTTNEAGISPKVALLTATLSGGIHSYGLQYIYLKAQPGSDVLDLDKANEVKEHARCIDQFADTLEATSFDSTNLEDSIGQYALSQKLDAATTAELLRRLKDQRGVYGSN